MSATAPEALVDVSPAGLVEATERLYHSLFAAAGIFAVGTVGWGLVIVPFNSYGDHRARSLAIGAFLLVAASLLCARREEAFLALRRQPAWLILVAGLTISALWLDGGWRSSFYLASYVAVVLAAVTAGLRWSLACALLAAAGYVAGLAINGYTWTELRALKDADSIIANTGGYLIAAVGLALPVSWLGGYVARINQVLQEAKVASGVAGDGPVVVDPALTRLRTKTLSVREVEVAQLVAAGLTNHDIASRLYLSDRTVQSHVRNAMRKSSASNRAELAALAEREGLVPRQTAEHRTREAQVVDGRAGR